MTTHQPSTQQPATPSLDLARLPWRDVALDVITLTLLLTSLFLSWNFTSDVHDHWWLVLLVMFAALGLLASPLAWFGVLGRGWQPVWNRGIRAVTAAPLLLSFVVLVVLDLLGDPSGAQGWSARAAGGVGTGAMFIVLAVVLHLQTREHEHDPQLRFQQVADVVWWRATQVAAMVCVGLVLITGLVHFPWDGDAGLFTVFPVTSLLSSVVITGAFAVGLLLSSPAWANAHLAVVGFSLVIALFPVDPGAAGVNLWNLLRPESIHFMGYGAWLFAVVAIATLDAGTRRFIGPRTTEPALHRAVAYLAALIVALTVLAVASSVVILIEVSDGATTAWLVVYLLTIVVGALGALSLAVPAGRMILLLCSSLGLGFLLFVGQIINVVNDFDQAAGWVRPFVIGGTLAGLSVAPWITRQVRDRHGSPGGGPSGTGPSSATPTPAPAAPSAPHRPAAQTTPTPPAPAWGSPAPASPALPASTSPAELARIVAEEPALRPAVAAHPQAYPDLLDWLAELGDPAVDDALRRRGHR